MGTKGDVDDAESRRGRSRTKLTLLLRSKDVDRGLRSPSAGVVDMDSREPAQRSLRVACNHRRQGMHGSVLYEQQRSEHYYRTP